MKDFSADTETFKGTEPENLKLSCFLKLKETGHQEVCLVRREGPTTILKTTDTNLGCVFVKKPFYADPSL